MTLNESNIISQFLLLKCHLNILDFFFLNRIFNILYVTFFQENVSKF